MNEYDILYGSGELLIEKFCGGRKMTFALSEKSLGFRKGLRTEDGIFLLTTILEKYVKKGKKCSLVL